MIKWLKQFLPFTTDGRATLIYVMFAGAGPAVMGAIIYAMRTIRNWTAAPANQRLDLFAGIADKLAWGLLIVLVTLACFISIRAIRFGKDGFNVNGNGSAGDGAQLAADAAQETADTIKDATP